jgi:hypothetical protein
MKKTTLTLALAGLMIASAAIVSSCKKKDSTTTTTTPAPDTNASTAADNNQAEQHSNDAENIGAQANESGSLSTFRLSGGNASPFGAQDSVVKTTVGGVDIYTVTFTNFVGLDGHTRNGVISYTVSPSGAHYRDANMVMTVSTPNVGGTVYTVDGNTVTINKTITNMGIIAPSAYGNNMQWDIVTSISVAKASGGTFTWNAGTTASPRTHVLLNTNSGTMYDGNSVITAYNGVATAISWNEAIIQINGNATGTSVDGLSYSVSTNNVVRNMQCTPYPVAHPHFHPFVAGTVDFTPSGKTTRIINFGNGACTTNNQTYTISIGSWSETLAWF